MHRPVGHRHRGGRGDRRRGPPASVGGSAATVGRRSRRWCASQRPPPARGGRRPRTPRRWSAAGAAPTGPSRPASTSIEVSGQPGARLSARRSGGRAPATSCSTASPSTTSPRPTSAPRPACGSAHVQPTGRLELHRQDRRPGAAAPGSAAPPATSPTSTRAACDAELATPAGLGRRTVDLPAGRYDTLLPPTAGRRPDDLRLLDRRRRDAARGPHGLRPAWRRHPDRRAARPGRRGRLCSATRRTRAWSALPFVATAAERRRRSASSTTGCRSAGPTGSRDGVLTALVQTAAHGGARPVGP